MVNTKAMVIRAAAFFAVVALTAVGAFIFMIDSEGYSATNKYVADLYAGQNILVGEVRVWNTWDSDGDPEYVKVEFVITDDDWLITEIHVELKETLSEIPQKNGNPIPGQFSIKETFDPATDYAGPYSFDVSALFWGDWVYIAAHAVVETDNGENGEYQEETAWGGDNDFPGKNWAQYIKFQLTKDEDDDEDDNDETSETAWAYGDETFIELDLSSKWGWVVTYQVGETGFSTPIYAGAGRNVISNGYLAGYLYVSNDANYIYIEYELEAGVDMTEAQVYVGESYPTTVAPGLLGHNSGALDHEDGYEFKIAMDSSWATGDTLYIAAHAVVYA